jgi:hypothetical protein
VNAAADTCQPLAGVWQVLRDAGVAAPVESDILYYVLVGAATLPYVNAPGRTECVAGYWPRAWPKYMSSQIASS